MQSRLFAGKDGNIAIVQTYSVDMNEHIVWRLKFMFGNIRESQFVPTFIAVFQTDQLTDHVE